MYYFQHNVLSVNVPFVSENHLSLVSVLCFPAPQSLMADAEEGLEEQKVKGRRMVIEEVSDEEEEEESGRGEEKQQQAESSSFNEAKQQNSESNAGSSRSGDSSQSDRSSATTDQASERPDALMEQQPGVASMNKELSKASVTNGKTLDCEIPAAVCASGREDDDAGHESQETDGNKMAAMSNQNGPPEQTTASKAEPEVAAPKAPPTPLSPGEWSCLCSGMSHIRKSLLH